MDPDEDAMTITGEYDRSERYVEGESMKTAISEIKATQWINARDEMPDSDQTVLIFCPDETEPVFMGFHDGEQWVTVELVPVCCTYWMPLPDPPEG